MDLVQLIKSRRSIKRFEDREVSTDFIIDLLDTAVWAPNHHVTQPWRFILFNGEGREKLANAAREWKISKEPNPAKKQEEGDKLYDKLMANPAFLLVVMEEHPILSKREEDLAATSCLIQNFSLLAWEQGLGMTWHTQGWLHEPIVREAIGIKPGERILANLHMGYAEMVPKAQPRKSAKELMTVVESK
ncbi:MULTISPECIES: nitroreductase family protein [Bacillus]|uniref:nitroreductase family protein n=1 Tax=Bacillus TaxID=1386 RepID=UPI000300F45B|nr:MULTISPECIES: nitroreductase [Bacillus]